MFILILFICLSIIRIYICDRTKLDYFLAGMYPVNIITFIFVAITISFNSNKSIRFWANSMLVIGVVMFSIASILSLKNIKKQHINTNKLILFIINFLSVIFVIPAFLISVVIFLIDLGIFIKYFGTVSLSERDKNF
ncbi:hypothetical protein [Clostridium sp.]|uniref:hypothetical protein n=1 Tax=Clostridium sp. TaxID=1506 RepID=UPI002A90DD43|nr:hypothetical protein [Clostridium sp.]MDY6012166.1 hypothetical protein [Clostridium sp.]